MQLEFRDYMYLDHHGDFVINKANIKFSITIPFLPKRHRDLVSLAFWLTSRSTSVP